MNLLDTNSRWVPVRADGGIGPLRWLSYRDLLCSDGTWRISLTRDDMELACLQLLVSLTQVIFLPKTLDEAEDRIDTPLSENEFDAAVASYVDWFDLDHPTQPFMQTRGVEAKEATPIQKLMVGLPEGNNHCFFNPAGEIKQISAPIAAIALFNQAMNCPSFGGGFKGSLRGSAPITTLVDANDLRRQVWSNVVNADLLLKDLPTLEFDPARDRPTWVEPIAANATLHATDIGLARGLFWQPAHVELIPGTDGGVCDVLRTQVDRLYVGFRKAKFKFTLEGVWPHPHGARSLKVKKGGAEIRFQSFTTTAPGWTRLADLVAEREAEKDEGTAPAAPVKQARALEIAPLHLLVGGYRNKQAAVIERRHELMTLGRGWAGNTDAIRLVVETGLAAKDALRHKLYFAVKGSKDKGLEGVAAPIHEIAEAHFYARTESLMLDVIADEQTFADWGSARNGLIDNLSMHCRRIFAELTDPYSLKPELIPIIAWARRSLNNELKRLKEGK